jgi:hypothetical protein
MLTFVSRVRSQLAEHMPKFKQNLNLANDLHDDHSVEQLASLLSLAPPTVPGSPQTTPVRASSPLDVEIIGACDICADLTGSTCRLTQERVTYHMHAKFDSSLIRQVS